MESPENEIAMKGKLLIHTNVLHKRQGYLQIIL